MKSPVINSFCAIRPRLPRGLPRIAQAGIALTGAACMLTLSGCYYPYGYYPGYYPYYATVPAAGAQREVPVGTAGDPASQQQQQAQAAQQAQANSQTLPPAYVVAQPPPVYVAPAYPAYYPPPVYPAYYGYPGWYGPSVSIGFGFGGYWGRGHGGWGGHGHYH
ncbi:hypothetical protein ACAX43_24415 [Paraburkholderia sp. IW21]|uniref:hypothetical protein n=1 Tax=Paraburkholderia sp. IW21 TaxID=3242488 RepID=UPI0035218717